MRTATRSRRAQHALVTAALLFGLGAPAPAQDVDALNLGLTPVREPRIVGTSVDFLAQKFEGESGFGQKSGVYPELGNMITGSGWISAGPGLRSPLFNGHVIVDASVALSWRAYEMAQARVEFPTLLRRHLAVGGQVMGQDLTQVSYYGRGPDSLSANRSEYRMRYGEALAYAKLHNELFAVDAQVGWLGRPLLGAPSGWFDRGSPDIHVVFPGEPAAALDRQPHLLRSSFGVTADTRNYPGHPTAGLLVQAKATIYSDRDAGTFSYKSYELEAAEFVPVMNQFWTVALHGHAIAADVPAGHDVPFYLLPTLGGQNTIRGYSDFRFHDRNALVLNAESRWGITDHVDAAIFADAGNVAPAFGQLDLGHRAYGAGVRLHSTRETYARFDVARSNDEGWKVFFRVTEPFHLDRVGRRTADLPAVP